VSKRSWTCPNYGRYFWDTTLEPVSRFLDGLILAILAKGS